MALCFEPMRIAYREVPARSAKRPHVEAPLIPCRAFEDVFDAVKGGATRGAPNREHRMGSCSTGTSICCSSTTCQSSANSSCPSCTICSRCPAPGTVKVRRIYSHPQALARCNRFLRTLGGWWRPTRHGWEREKLEVADERLADAAAIRVSACGRSVGSTCSARRFRTTGPGFS